MRRITRRAGRVVLAFAAVVLLSAATSSETRAPSRSSDAGLRERGSSRSSTAQPKLYTARTVFCVPAEFLSDDEVVNNLVCQVLRASTLYTDVAQAMGLIERDADSVAEYQLAEALARHTEVPALQAVHTRGRPDRLSWWVTVEFSDPDPAKAKAVMHHMTPIFRHMLDEKIRTIALGSARGVGERESFGDIKKLYHNVLDRLRERMADVGVHGQHVDSLDDALREKGAQLKDVRHHSQRLQMDLAIERVLAERLQERLAEEAMAARKAEEEDPIARELETLVEIAERGYEAGARLVEVGGISREELDQKKKAVTEARLALLRRREEFAARTVGARFGKMKEELIRYENGIVKGDAQIEQNQNLSRRIEHEIAVLEETLRDIRPLTTELSELEERLERQKSLPPLREPTVLDGTSLVVP